MNIPTSKWNKQHSKPNDAKVKNTFPFTSNKQNKSNYFFLKQISNSLKYLRFTSIEWDLQNLQMQNNAQEAITQNNEGIENQTINW